MIKVSNVTINGLYEFFIDEWAEVDIFDCILDQFEAEYLHYSNFNNIKNFEVVYVKD